MPLVAAEESTIRPMPVFALSMTLSMMCTRQAELPFLSARFPDLSSHRLPPQIPSFSFPSDLSCVALSTVCSPLEHEMMELGALEGPEALQQRSLFLCLVFKDSSGEKALKFLRTLH